MHIFSCKIIEYQISLFLSSSHHIIDGTFPQLQVHVLNSLDRIHTKFLLQWSWRIFFRHDSGLSQVHQQVMIKNIKAHPRTYQNGKYNLILPTDGPEFLFCCWHMYLILTTALFDSNILRHILQLKLVLRLLQNKLSAFFKHLFLNKYTHNSDTSSDRRIFLKDYQ